MQKFQFAICTVISKERVGNLRNELKRFGSAVHFVNFRVSPWIWPFPPPYSEFQFPNSISTWRPTGREPSHVTALAGCKRRDSTEDLMLLDEKQYLKLSLRRFCYLSGLFRFSSVQDGIFWLGNAHMCFNLSFRSVHSVSFETGPVLVARWRWPFFFFFFFFRPFKVDRRALPLFRLSLPSVVDSVMASPG